MDSKYIHVYFVYSMWLTSSHVKAKNIIISKFLLDSSTVSKIPKRYVKTNRFNS